MTSKRPSAQARRFVRFFDETEPRLRRALVSAYGPVDGRDAVAAAFAWAWEHWNEVESYSNPAGYLYRVGQSSMRPRRAGLLPGTDLDGEWPDVDLRDALHNLTTQQRNAVLLVHAFGWRLEEAADVMAITVSTLRNHLHRGLNSLRNQLEPLDAVHR